MFCYGFYKYVHSYHNFSTLFPFGDPEGRGINPRLIKTGSVPVSESCIIMTTGFRFGVDSSSWLFHLDIGYSPALRDPAGRDGLLDIHGLNSDS